MSASLITPTAPASDSVDWSGLATRLTGELESDSLARRLFATDASVYQQHPQAVAFPSTAEDIGRIVSFCVTNEVAIIPRAAGTSLAGQCVGSGLVVDVSRHFNTILAIDPDLRQVRVQPGVVRDELNRALAPHGLFFAPITSTANRATLGGMVGNNSCGTNSIVYGDTRRYVRALKGVLADGSPILVTALTPDEFAAKLAQPDAEGQLYREIISLLEDPDLPRDLERHFPKATVTRRNTGYALDALLAEYQNLRAGGTFNLAPLLTGSEGTLLFVTEITVDVVPLPEPHSVVAVLPFDSIDASMRAVTAVMRHQPHACELMDRTILDCTRGQPLYEPTLAYIQGDPAAVLLVELRAATADIATSLVKKMIADLRATNHGYGHTWVSGPATADLWALRAAGLGLLANLPGDPKGVACIEDTAVAIEDLADYMRDFAAVMERFGQKVVYYAHAGAGEIHLRPILNLKQAEDRRAFYDITLAVAELVKKYRGSLSGEHGDGRVRAPFIPLVVGEANYARFRYIKRIFDPHNRFNPAKIVESAPMNEELRYAPDASTPAFATVFDFSATEGILRLAEKCNGSGDCRKLPGSGGTMCPSYRATRHECDSTRGRANVLRQVLTENAHQNPFAHPDLTAALDLCLSCKGCTAECPSRVDMSTLKAEVTHQRHQSEGIPLRSRVFAHIDSLNRLGRLWPSLTNAALGLGELKRMIGIAPARDLPRLSPRSWRALDRKVPIKTTGRPLFLFADAFTNHNDAELGHTTRCLLEALGYAPRLIDHPESGRAAISKGLLHHARRCAEKNVRLFANIVNADEPLVGVEPSAILSFRDEYPKLVRPALRPAAGRLAEHCLTLEEFLIREIKAFRVTAAAFDQRDRKILVHGHCHQKALTDFRGVHTLLSLPAGHQVELLNTGCCGMAGSFGYEVEHYELSMQIGETTLFPTVRAAAQETLIVAAGTSCRHQILDGTGRRALHPAEVLWQALRKSDRK